MPVQWSQMVDLLTTRLRLLPLPLSALRLLLNKGRKAMERSLGLNHSSLQVPSDVQTEYRTALALSLMRATEDPTHVSWHTTWEIILRDKNHAIGGMGLSGLPSETGEVLIGYWLDSRHHNQGYMTEAVGGLCKWVFEQSDATTVTASVPSNNSPSQRVLLKNNFLPDPEQRGISRWVRQRSDAQRIILTDGCR